MSILSHKGLFVIIPAYNEEKTIAEVIRKTKKYADNIIVVDDGSCDNSAKIAKEMGAIVYSHSINRGLGGALGTGIKAALIHGAEIIITLDADGQHDPCHISSLIEPIISSEVEVVIGSRFLNNQKIPFLRKFYNKIGNLVTYFLFGIKTTDSQSGFRVFSRRAAELLELKTNRMEVSSEIFKEIKANNLRFKEVAIEAIYTEYSLSKGQGALVGLKTLIKLLILKIT